MKRSSNGNFTVYEEADECALDEYSETLGEELETTFGEKADLSETLIILEEEEIEEDEE